jgi:hypothetical protein
MPSPAKLLRLANGDGRWRIQYDTRAVLEGARMHDVWGDLHDRHYTDDWEFF